MTPEQRERKRLADKAYAAEHCLEARARVKAWKAANPNRVRENHRAYYLRHKDRPTYRQRNIERQREKEQAYATTHADLLRAIKAKHYAANRSAIIARSKVWAETHREDRKRISREYTERHPGKVRALHAVRRAAEHRACPAWANRAAIVEIYSKAAKATSDTGIKHVVDHYYPLRGKTVCGLHVESNLRVITHDENIRKRNLHPDYFGAASVESADMLK